MGNVPSRRSIRCTVAAMLTVLAPQLTLGQANRNQWNPTILEVQILPKYCHGQFIPALKGQPGYRIENCGVYTNHFCPGLVLLNRAADYSKPRETRREILREARIEIGYTRNFLPKGCPIEPDIQAAEMRLKMMETGIGVK